MTSTTNRATVGTSSEAGDKRFSGEAAVVWGAPTTTTDGCVTVDDDILDESFGPFCVDEDGTFGPEVIAEYDLTVGPVANCETEELINTATVLSIARVPVVLDSDSETVSASVPCYGCTPGGFKNSPARWTGTGYTTGMTLEAVFDVPNSLGYDNTTLLQALDFGGGSGVAGASRTLLRAAVAAVLNAYHQDINYPLTETEVINQVNAALATGNRATMLALASTLDGYNNLGCPIDHFGNVIPQ